MQQWKERRIHQREERHRFGDTIDRSPPSLIEQKQKRGDERARVADPDPPHEVDDAVGPRDGNVVAPRADAARERHAHGDEEQQRERTRNSEERPPAARRCPVRRQEPCRQRAVVEQIVEERMRFERRPALALGACTGHRGASGHARCRRQRDSDSARGGDIERAAPFLAARAR